MLKLLNDVFLVADCHRVVDDAAIGGGERLSEISERGVEQTRLLRKRLKRNVRARHLRPDLWRAGSRGLEQEDGDACGGAAQERCGHTTRFLVAARDSLHGQTPMPGVARADERPLKLRPTGSRQVF